MKRVMKRSKKSIKRKRRRTMIGLVLMSLMAMGVVCVGVMANSYSITTSTESIFEAKNKSSDAKKVGGDIIIRDSDETLDDAMLEPIRDYFKTYFKALANLESEDITAMFVDSFSENAWINQASMDYLIQLRQSQSNDLKMTDYQCGLTVTSISEGYGEIEVVLVEDHHINFAFISNVDSYSSGIAHTFYLSETKDGYAISEHYKEEDSFLMLEEAIADSDENPQDVADQLLGEALAVIEELSREKDDFNMENGDSWTNSTDHSYDAEAAVDYAMTWVDPIEVLRNEDYGVYDNYGGNCNNYISQALFAGGIPMDSDGYNNTQWKWYGEEVDDEDGSDWGRSPAWTGVAEFYTYASENEGYGLAALVDENVFSGSMGDVLQYGHNGDWLHSVIISDVINDDDGNMADYLINSNTTDRINYPASAYGYSELRLIKVLGWNDGD